MGKGGRQHRGWHSEHAQGVLVAVTDGLGSCCGDGRSHREEWRCGNAAEQGEQVQLVRPASLQNCGGEERKGAEALPQGTVRSESQSVAGQRKGGAGRWLPTWTRVRGGPHRRRPASFTQRSVFKSPPRLSWSDGASLLSAEGCPILPRRHRLSTRLPKDCSVASEFGQLRTKLL